MEGRIKKSSEKYKECFYRKELIKKGIGQFYISDFKEIYEIIDKNKSSNSIYKAITTALQAGFMIGYKTAIKMKYAEGNNND